MLGSLPGAKINGFMSVAKPDGSHRQVGNLSLPKGKSFNDGIHQNTLKIWSFQQTTSKQIANMISRAGPNCMMSCSDMVSAYKNLPVTIDQRKLQVFRFCGKEFVDLCLVLETNQHACCMTVSTMQF